MANIVIWSDLHCEFDAFKLPDVADFDAVPDMVLLAGDTDKHPNHLHMARHIHEAYNCPVVLVDGNHEFYRKNMDEVFIEEDEIIAGFQASGLPIHLLRGDAVEVAGTRIVGATLWTDFDLNPAFSSLSRKLAARSMNDYSVIQKGVFPHQSHLVPLDTIAMHVNEKHKILEHLRAAHEGPTVVMTHHMPAKELIHPQYESDPLNPAFASDLLAEVSQYAFDAWLFGHTHNAREINVEDDTTFSGRRRFVSNTRGYPREATTFDPLRMLFL